MKFIAIALEPETATNQGGIAALSEEGEIWMHSGGYWTRLHGPDESPFVEEKANAGTRYEYQRWKATYPEAKRLRNCSG